MRTPSTPWGWLHLIHGMTRPWARVAGSLCTVSGATGTKIANLTAFTQCIIPARTFHRRSACPVGPREVADVGTDHCMGMQPLGASDAAKPALEHAILTEIRMA